MGKYIGYIVDTALLNNLQDVKYVAKYNNFIKSKLPKLSETIQMLKDGKYDEANIYLQKIYLDNFLAWDGEDNWFCYHLGNKLNKEAGLEPLNPDI